MIDELAEAWRELDDDPEVRVIVNTGDGPHFQTGARRRRARRDPGGAARAVASDQAGRPALHRVAPPGVEAGDRRRQRHLRRRRVPLRGRRRHRDRGERRQFLDPHVSVGQVMAYEAIGLVRKMPFEAVMRMAIVGRYERMTRDARLRARHDLRDRRSAREPARRARRSWPRRSRGTRPAAMAATKRALWGALEMGLTDACRAGAQRPRVDVGPSRPGRRPPGVRREARREVQQRRGEST